MSEAFKTFCTHLSSPVEPTLLYQASLLKRHTFVCSFLCKEEGRLCTSVTTKHRFILNADLLSCFTTDFCSVFCTVPPLSYSFYPFLMPSDSNLWRALIIQKCKQRKEMAYQEQIHSWQRRNFHVWPSASTVGSYQRRWCPQYVSFHWGALFLCI